MKKFITLYCVVALLAACSKNDDAPISDIPEGMGAVAFVVTPQSVITTRAGEGQIDLSTLGVKCPASNGSDMNLTITPPEGGYVETPEIKFSYEGTVGEYNGHENREARKRYIPSSSEPYKAMLSWGNPSSEGTNEAYFEIHNQDGTSEQGFIVEKQSVEEIQLSAKMVKAIVRVNFTPEFRSYFANGAKLKLTTKAGAQFEIGYTAEGTESNINTPFFVLAGAENSFTISGEATKQRPAANVDPQTVVFDPIGRDGTDAGGKVAVQTMYTYTFDVENANYVTVTVSINNEPIGTEVIGTEELNDDAVMDPDPEPDEDENTESGDNTGGDQGTN